MRQSNREFLCERAPVQHERGRRGAVRTSEELRRSEESSLSEKRSITARNGIEERTNLGRILAELDHLAERNARLGELRVVGDPGPDSEGKRDFRKPPETRAGEAALTPV